MKKILFLISILFVFSCEDYLQEDNPNAPEFDVVFNNLNDTSKSLIAVYNSLNNSTILNLEYEVLRGDEAITQNRPTLNSGNQPGNLRLLLWAQHNVDKTNLDVSAKWAALYRGIWFANQTIEGLNRIQETLDGDTELAEWTSQMAQARFFRGLYHFYLHTSYNNGSVIIRDKYSTKISDTNKSLSSAEDVRTFFREDLQYAYDNLAIPTQQTGRVTKGTAAMILANSYLYEGTTGLHTGNASIIEKAKDLYEEIIDDFGYQLADPSILFTSKGEYSQESIFEIAYSNTINNELDQFNELNLHNRIAWQSTLGSFGGNQRFLPSAWLIHEYSGEELDQTNPRNFIDGDINGDQRSVSLRASSMITLVKDLETPLYGSPNAYQIRVTNPNNGNTSSPFGGGQNIAISMFKKYNNHDTVDNEQNNNANNALKSGKNVIVNRLAEAHFNLAECYLKLGMSVDLAREQINIVRRRWGVKQLGLGNPDQFNNVAYDATSLMVRLAEFEKPLELSVEGHSIRTIDLRRWGIWKERLTTLSNNTYEAAHFPAIPVESYPLSVAAAGGSFTEFAFNSQVVLNKDLNGQTVETWSRSRDGGNRPSSSVPVVVFEEFITSSANFNQTEDSYLPIPADEEVNNSNVNN